MSAQSCYEGTLTFSSRIPRCNMSGASGASSAPGLGRVGQYKFLRNSSWISRFMMFVAIEQNTFIVPGLPVSSFLFHVAPPSLPFPYRFERLGDTLTPPRSAQYP